MGGELGEGEPDARLNYSKRKTTDEEGDLNWMRVVLGVAETTPIRKKKRKIEMGYQNYCSLEEAEKMEELCGLSTC